MIERSCVTFSIKELHEIAIMCLWNVNRNATQKNAAIKVVATQIKCCKNNSFYYRECTLYLNTKTCDIWFTELKDTVKLKILVYWYPFSSGLIRFHKIFVPWIAIFLYYIFGLYEIWNEK